ncbi:MAG: hypothetical protein KAT71_02445 [Gammaproteobacteria bacterium]|nr:hypothetical protein [Gammaproteobacteria bacterium]
MTGNELLKHIIDRLGYSDDAQAIFGFDESNDWFTGAIDMLMQNGLLQQTQPAKNIDCNGCEKDCLMEVNIYPPKGKLPARAFIACDKRNDVGRILVELRDLEQWQISGELLANTLNKLLTLSQSPKRNNGGREWMLGMLKGKKYNGDLTLSIENGILLKIAGHNIPLIEVLTINKGKLSLDKIELVKLVDKPAKQSNAEGYISSTSKLELRNRKTQKRDAKLQKKYEELKKKYPDKSKNWITIQMSQQIKGAPTAGRIYRIVKNN